MVRIHADDLAESRPKTRTCINRCMNKIYYTIYKITNKINGKTYIGLHKTKNLNDGYMGSGKYLNYAIKKYGIENFQKEILFIFDNKEDMYSKETELVNEEYLSENNTYNLNKGGYGGFDIINSNTEIRIQLSSIRAENVKKVSAKGRKKIFELYENPEYFQRMKQNVSKSMKSYIQENGHWWNGKTHTDETKKKMSEKQKNLFNDPTKNPMYNKCWITNDIENKVIEKNSLIPEGFRKGRKNIPSSANGRQKSSELLNGGSIPSLGTKI